MNEMILINHVILDHKKKNYDLFLYIWKTIRSIDVKFSIYHIYNIINCTI